jgi:hypothetical protein
VRFPHSKSAVSLGSRLPVAIRAFDTEPGTVGVLKRFYPAATMLNGSAVAGQRAIVDEASGDAVTLVDGRAGLLGPMLKSFDRIKLIDDVRSGVFQLLVLHIVGPSVASASEVPTVVAAMEGASLIRVNNHVSTDAEFAPPVSGQTVIDIPNLDEMACAAVDHASLGFTAFVNTPAQSRVLRGHVRAWLGDVHSALGFPSCLSVGRQDCRFAQP